jgi:four helix bundle protein
MAKIEKFEVIDSWKKAVSIGVEIYHLTSKVKLQKDYSSKDQLRSAAISISDNIADGSESNNNKVFARFRSYAKVSAEESSRNLFVHKAVQRFIKYLKSFELKKKLIVYNHHLPTVQSSHFEFQP